MFDFDRRRGFSTIRGRGGVTAAILALAVGQWIVLLSGGLPMPGAGALDRSFVAPGVPEQWGVHHPAAYLVMWTVMMNAMMYPAILPYLRGFYGHVDGDTVRKAGVTTAFLAVYSAIWGVVGVIPLATASTVDFGLLAGRTGDLTLGVVLVLAGAYQLSDVKRAFLNACCRPADLHVHRIRTVTDAARTGVEHAVTCLGTTWLLFAVMVVAGSMNPVWMFGVTAVVAGERVVPWGDEVAATVGVLALAGGVGLCAVAVLPV